LEWFYQMGQAAVDLMLEAVKAPDQQPDAGEVSCVVLDAELRIGESAARPAGCSAVCRDQQIPPKPRSLDSREPAA
jgi:DNA-binding LacI/PurR family transcriptional regulator